MPAVEADTLALPRIERPDLAAALDPVLGIVDAVVTLEGQAPGTAPTPRQRPEIWRTG